MRYLNGEESRLLTTLEDSRPFVHFNNLLFIASGHIATIAENHFQRPTARGEEWIEIKGIEEVMGKFASTLCNKVKREKRSVSETMAY